MKGKLLKVLSLAMAISLVASLAACGGKGGDETTAPADTTVADDVTPGVDESTPDASGEEASSEEATVTEIVTDADGHTKIVVETKAPNAPTKAPANPDTSAATMSVKDIVAIFNKGAGAMTSASLNRVLDNGKVKKNDPIKVLGQEIWINLDLGKEQAIKDYFSSAKTLYKNDNTIYTIKETDVASATCKDNGSTYTVTINLKPANLPVTTAKHGDAGYSYFIEINEAHEVVKGMIKTLVKLPIGAEIVGGTITLSNGQYVATVDKASGKITKATYKFSESVNAQAKALGQTVEEANITGHGTVNYSK